MNENKNENKNEKEEGETCIKDDCIGIYEYIKNGQCNCHINPPCAACENSYLICNSCGEMPTNE